MQTASNIPLRQARIAASLALLAMLLSTFFITRSYRLYNQTYDESAHIACGMQWLSEGSYTYETLHPPFARVATALLPYLDGARTIGHPVLLEEGNALLNRNGQYWKNLTLSRLGILPFFWFLGWVIYRFMARRFGPWCGALAVSLTAFCPPLLAHMGLATTDAPLVTMFTWSFLRFFDFLEKPSTRNAAWAGFSFGLACLTKFTEIPFFLLAATVLLGMVWVQRRRFPLPLPKLLFAAVLVPVILWSGYRFSFGPIITPQSMTPSTASNLATASPTERKLLTQTSVPADEFFRGIIMAKGAGSSGRQSYLLGQTYGGGRKLFFPVAVLSKTPIPLLLLFFCGVGLFIVVPSLRSNVIWAALLLGVASPMLVGMAGKMNIGMRHVLPVFPFMAMLAAAATSHLWQISSGNRKNMLRAGVVLLLALEAMGCAWAEPDFLPYFNIAAAPHADHILLNSDLDWGQSLHLLEDRLRQDHAQHVSIAYFGNPGIDMSGLPPYSALEPGKRATGWVAISESIFMGDQQDYAWLKPYPYTLIGKSIRLYHVQP